MSPVTTDSVQSGDVQRSQPYPLSCDAELSTSRGMKDGRLGLRLCKTRFSKNTTVHHAALFQSTAVWSSGEWGSRKPGQLSKTRNKHK